MVCTPPLTYHHLGFHYLYCVFVCVQLCMCVCTCILLCVCTFARVCVHIVCVYVKFSSTKHVLDTFQSINRTNDQFELCEPVHYDYHCLPSLIPTRSCIIGTIHGLMIKTWFCCPGVRGPAGHSSLPTWWFHLTKCLCFFKVKSLSYSLMVDSCVMVNMIAIAV